LRETGKTRLAKLTRPRLHGAVARERLFALLDSQRSRSAICVVGPPGAGKTTLVASWADQRDLPGIWYQVDPGDADIATFFYYLAQAAAPFASRDRKPLPLLTPEYVHDIPGFTRRFFRELFGRLPPAAVLVLDNYQEVGPQERFHEIVSIAVNEAPPGITLIAVSRANPPAHYARLIANDNVALVEWEDLQFSLDETRAIAEQIARLSDAEVRALHESSGGWAAGLTLLLERRRRDASASLPVRVDGLDRVFDYFASEIFQHVSAEVRRFLMQTAFLPRATASAARKLTGRADAGDILEDFYRRHLFTHRRPGAEPTYQYHALFQTFLLARAQSALRPEERRDTKAAAARLLEESGMAVDALALYRETGEWSEYVRLVQGEAADLVAQGRGQTLREWILLLPEEVLRDEPWMSYWFGTSEIAQMPASARTHLDQAFAGFEQRGNAIGQSLAASGMIETYYREMSYFQPMDRWLEILEGLVFQVESFDSVETGLRVHSTLLLAIMYRRPSHPTREHYSREVMKALDADIGPNALLTAATFLVSYCTLTSALDLGRQLAERFGSLPSQPTVTPINRYWWYGRLGFLYYHTGEFALAIEMMGMADEVAESHGIRPRGLPTPLFAHYRFLPEVDGGELDAAATTLQKMEAAFDPSRGFDHYHVRSTRLEYKLATGDTAGSREEARGVYEAAERSGMFYVMVRSQYMLCWASALTEGHEATMAEIEAVRGVVAGGSFSYYEPALDTVESFSLLRHGRVEESHAVLRRALSTARSREAPLHNGSVRPCMERLCAEALQAGIEVDYVKALVRRYGFHPPIVEVRNWPWLVRIYTLGRFEVHCNDVALKFAGKAPKKPLALLKMVAAAGPDGLPKQRILDALWADEEGDAAQNAFTVALVRLRKLLGSADAVLVQDQSLRLNPRLCWVDAWAFERLAMDPDLRPDGEGVESAGLADRGLELYRGSFLPSDGDAQWALQTRLRLRSRFTRFMEAVGLSLERTMQWQKALDCYHRGLEADDLIEEFYLGLMRCHRALGRPADGIAVFRRMRQTLSVVLNIAPSPSAETLARELREAAPEGFRDR